MSKRINNKKGNRVRHRWPNKYSPCKVRGGYHGNFEQMMAWMDGHKKKRLERERITDEKHKEAARKAYGDAHV